MKIQLRSRALRLLLILGTVFAGATGVAYATGTFAGASTATDVIQACQNSDGTLRVVANNANDCKKHELAISWNVVGPKGEMGDPGHPGAPGATGEPGKDGANGASGLDGKNGVDGRDGLDGMDGAPGKDGTPGKDGAPGSDGAPAGR